MVLRFRKSFKVAPGVRLNVSRSGSSLSLGGRGLTTNYSARGTRTTLSIPGSGLSFSSSSGRSAYAEQRRFDRAEKQRLREEALSRVRISVDDDGVVSWLDANGEQLNGRELTMAWDQHGDGIATLLDEAAENINGDVYLLDHIFHDAPHPTPSKLLSAPPFHRPEPESPNHPSTPKEPVLILPEPPGFFAKLFGGQGRYERKVLRAQVEHSAAIERREERRAEQKRGFEQALRIWQDGHRAWSEAREAYLSKIEQAERTHRQTLASDEDYASQILEAAISDLEWPRETLTSFELEIDKARIWLDVDLPEIEDLPQRVATLAASGRKLNVKTKSQKAMRLEYARHIHGIALRLASVVAATLPWSETIIVSGYSQRLDKATGHVNDDYLYSVQFTRDGLERLNYDDLASIDPVSAIEAFEHHRQMTATGMFKPISPYAPE